MITGEQIGALIKKVREKRKLTAHALAKKAGVSHIEVYRLERGEIIPRVDTLDMIFKALEYRFVIGGGRQW